eukprot:c37274_g1_i1 orf=168-320(+)
MHMSFQYSRWKLLGGHWHSLQQEDIMIKKIDVIVYNRHDVVYCENVEDNW